MFDRTINNSRICNYFNFLIALIPLSFIVGNTIININLILIILSTFFFFKNFLFKLQYFIVDKLLFIFFLLILFSAISNDINYYLYHKDFSDWKGPYETTLKSLGFFRFFILYLSIRYLIENKIINLKFFFISCTIFTTLVCLDIFYQLYFGKDVFGYKSIARKFPGPFGDEPIAGGYILRFSLFALFLYPIYLLNKSLKFSYLFLAIFLIIYPTAILISGNRMPLLLFILLITSIFIFQKDLRKFFLLFCLIFSLVFLLAFKFNDKVKGNFINLNYQINEMVSFIIPGTSKGNETKVQGFNTYLDQFKSFKDTWLMNKYIGGGIKNFRYNCHLAKSKIDKKKYICNMHPHNYYLEILTETGIAGFLLIFAIFILSFYNVISKISLATLVLNYQIITPFIFLFLIEVFPFKGTGSFFTTVNASYLFLIMGIMIGLVRKQN